MKRIYFAGEECTQYSSPSVKALEVVTEKGFAQSMFGEPDLGMWGDELQMTLGLEDFDNLIMF